MSAYQVIGSVRSRTMRVLWALEELGLDYDHVSAGPRSDEVLALNATGKVPVMIVDGTPVTDSVAIMTFLADRHGALTFPAGSLERATQDAFTHAVNDEIDAILWTAARHGFILPEERRMPEIKDSLRWEFARNQGAIADRIVGPFVMGDTMTIADILLAHCVGWAEAAKFPVSDPRLVRHNEMMRARPAFKAALAKAKQ